MRTTVIGRGLTAAASAVLALALASCAGGVTTATEPTTAAPAPAASTPTPTPTPELTAADIEAWVADAAWSFAPDGLGVPEVIEVAGGTATDGLGRTYTVGAAVEADVNGDGVADAAIPITQADGNAATELWYLWLGQPDAAEVVAEQVVYPIARTTRCGDVTHAVTAVDGGVQIDLALRMPFTDDAVPCSDPGTGTLTRVVHVEEIGGEQFPVQTAPVPAWGGICPPSPWLDAGEEFGISARATPHADAPVVTDPSQGAGIFAMPEAPLVTASGASFFGFIQNPDETQAVKLHCAFA